MFAKKTVQSTPTGVPHPQNIESPKELSRYLLSREFPETELGFLAFNYLLCASSEHLAEAIPTLRMWFKTRAENASGMDQFDAAIMENILLANDHTAPEQTSLLSQAILRVDVIARRLGVTDPAVRELLCVFLQQPHICRPASYRLFRDLAKKRSYAEKIRRDELEAFRDQFICGKTMESVKLALEIQTELGKMLALETT